jgi:ketosteroid isomerase-like protein
MRPAEILALADRFFGAIEAGDIEALREIYATDAVVWHNYDQVEQSLDENLVVLRWLTANVASVRYVDIRRRVLDDGFVQQHVLTGHSPGGPLTVPAMMLVQVSDGRITRIEEYLDTGQLGPLRQARAPE